jgi:hypothetical protein
MIAQNTGIAVEASGLGPVQTRMPKRGNAGFTLPEVAIASGLLVFVCAGVLAAFLTGLKMSVAGGNQVRFTALGREAAQKISRFVEDGKSVGVTTQGLEIVTVNLMAARIYLDDRDGDPDTVADNFLMYDPDSDPLVTGDEREICNYVSPIPGEPMFSLVPATPDAVSVCFHVGDGTNISHASFSGTGEGYQGVEVRVSATPRNLQRWYQ